MRLGGAVATGSVAFVVAVYALPFAPAVPRSIFLIEAALTTLGIAGVWLVYRLSFESSRRHQSRGGAAPRRVIIVGAGEAGSLLTREMVRRDHGYRVVGFVDDDPLKWGTRIQGIEVVGSTDDLAEIVRHLGAHEVIIVIPSAGPEALRRIVERCQGIYVPFKVLPGIGEVFAGDVGPGRVRELRIEDLLGRYPISLALPELGADLGGKTVLVTGAAGSIGSELARQIAVNRPGELILLDVAESAPGVPVLSEESEAREVRGRWDWPRLWIVDPLDGTKEFLKGTVHRERRARRRGVPAPRCGARSRPGEELPRVPGARGPGGGRGRASPDPVENVS